MSTTTIDHGKGIIFISDDHAFFSNDQDRLKEHLTSYFKHESYKKGCLRLGSKKQIPEHNLQIIKSFGLTILQGK